LLLLAAVVFADASFAAQRYTYERKRDFSGAEEEESEREREREKNRR